MNEPAPVPQIPATSPPPNRVVPRRLALDALHVFSLTSLVVAQSFYDRLARQPFYLVDPHVTPLAIAGLVVALSVVLPLLLVGLEYLAGRFHRILRESVHLGVVLLCATLLCLQFLNQVPILAGWMLIVIALGAACVLTWSYEKYPALQSVVTLSSPGIAVFPAILWMRLHAADASIAHRAIHDTSRDPIPIVMVVFDEFCGASLMTPERDIDALRFPNLSALRQSATWYRSASSVSPSTHNALPAILTGNYTKSQISLYSAALPQNLFALLSSSAQYDFAAFEPVTALAPRQLQLHSPGVGELFRQTAGLLNVLGHVYLYEICPPDVHARLPIIPPVWFGLHDSNQVDHVARRGSFKYGWTDRRDAQVSHFLRCIDSTPGSMLYFAHLLIPHAPWCYQPSGTRYARDRNSLDHLCLESDTSIMSDELGAIQNQQRHLLQVMYVDTVVGQLRARLEEVGIWDRCLLIVTADHGISFRLGQDRRQYSGGNAEDILSIPLFIKFPGQTVGEVNDLPVQSTDLLPTILDLVGIQPATPLEGVSVRDPRVALRQTVVVRDPQHNLSFSPEILHHSPVPDIIRTRFGTSDDRWNLFRIGPHPEWLGLPLLGLPQGTVSPRTLECMRPLKPAGATGPDPLPYYMEGRVISPDRLNQPVELIAVVNGVVCGTTRTYRQFGYTDRWSVMLPEWSELSPTTRPEFFSVCKDGTLTPCEMRWVDALGESTATP